jgi:hypothetical protein
MRFTPTLVEFPDPLPAAPTLATASLRAMARVAEDSFYLDEVAAMTTRTLYSLCSRNWISAMKVIKKAKLRLGSPIFMKEEDVRIGTSLKSGAAPLSGNLGGY